MNWLWPVKSAAGGPQIARIGIHPLVSRKGLASGALPFREVTLLFLLSLLALCKTFRLAGSTLFPKTWHRHLRQSRPPPRAAARLCDPVAL